MKGNSLPNTFLVVLITLMTSCGKDETKNTDPQRNDTAILSISNTPNFDFGFHAVDSITEKILTVTNLGSVTATQIKGDFYFSINFNYKGGAYPGEGGTCKGTLSSQAHCTLNVVFTPKSTGPFQTSLTLSYHNGMNSTSINGLTLSGQGN